MNASLDVKRHGAVSDQLSAVSDQLPEERKGLRWSVLLLALWLIAEC
jgi:hypothetical protein